MFTVTGNWLNPLRRLGGYRESSSDNGYRTALTFSKCRLPAFALPTAFCLCAKRSCNRTAANSRIHMNYEALTNTNEATDVCSSPFGIMS